MIRSFSDWATTLGVAALVVLLVVVGIMRQKQAPPKFQPTFADVRYGPAERNTLDFYQASGSRPAPVVVHIHGGGFVSGDKSEINAAMVDAFKNRGIHFASINYRYVNGKDVIFPAPQLDGARAVQFLRTKAREWRIDGSRIGCFGESAGAGISLWIAFHDDLADPDNADPVLRESSRIAAVGSIDGQPTYNPLKIRKLIGGRAWEHPSLFKNFGVRDAEEALNPSPAKLRLYDEGSAITWLTPDDPPVFMVYREADGPLRADAGPGQGIHHPNFGRMLEAPMNKLGIENVLINLDGGKVKDANEFGNMLTFFQRHLAAADLTAGP